SDWLKECLKSGIRDRPIAALPTAPLQPMSMNYHSSIYPISCLPVCSSTTTKDWKKEQPIVTQAQLSVIPLKPLPNTEHFQKIIGLLRNQWNKDLEMMITKSLLGTSSLPTPQSLKFCNLSKPLSFSVIQSSLVS